MNSPTEAEAPKRLAQPNAISDSVWSIVAIAVAMIFFFPIYWAVSNSLRLPAETFTVAGLGIPFVDFTPTLENWNSQVKVPEAMTPSPTAPSFRWPPLPLRFP